MNLRPAVSIVIPTHNRWSLLSRAALPSALAQEGVDVEVIVVDDGSRDETSERLAGLGDARVRVVRHESPRRVAAARNSGIAAARGDWLAFLDDDDVWAPDKLRRQLDSAAADGVSLAYSGVVVLDAAWRVIGVTIPEPVPDLRGLLLLRNVVPAGSSNVVVRTELVRSLGGFDERLHFNADWDLWLRLSELTSAAVRPEILVGYVRHPLSMAYGGRRARDEIRLLLHKHASAGLSFEPSRFLGWIASEHRTAGRRRDAVATYLWSAVSFRRARHLVSAVGTLVDADGTGPFSRLRGRRPVDPSGEPTPAPPWLERYRGAAAQ